MFNWEGSTLPLVQVHKVRLSIRRQCSPIGAKFQDSLLRGDSLKQIRGFYKACLVKGHSRWTAGLCLYFQAVAALY